MSYSSQGHEPPFQISSDPEVQVTVVEAQKGEVEETQDLEEKTGPNLQSSETAPDLAGEGSSPVGDVSLLDLVPLALNATVEETVPVLDFTSSGEEDLEAVPEGNPSTDDRNENEEEDAEEGTTQPVPSQELIRIREADGGVELAAVSHLYQKPGATGGYALLKVVG